MEEERKVNSVQCDSHICLFSHVPHAFNTFCHSEHTGLFEFNVISVNFNSM